MSILWQLHDILTIRQVFSEGIIIFVVALCRKGVLSTQEIASRPSPIFLKSVKKCLLSKLKIAITFRVFIADAIQILSERY